MDLGSNVEILAYVLTAGLAGSAGLILGITRSNRHKAIGLIAALLIVASVIVAGIVAGARAPWIGPIFAIVAVLTTLLTTAGASTDDPALRNERFGRRLVLAFFPKRHHRLFIDEEQ
ncbi:CHASE2 domain-containing sensor protein [Microbacterium natoriense]|uniref:CHASE2 domain-containing sensor protein n=1 Tax=Microbacterium natoriense TaxID=284570 RepID=A0AAW8EYI0_9MICO|nr:hypothetical protein [Microbacterium natoriense]MDQ0647281.1 CHASE2 domain-containing sensor protein [Microbacterium natoriense]